MLGIGEDRISIYLNDHLGGATAGLHLARRLASRNHSDVLDAIAIEIEEDRAALLRVMERLGVGEDVLKAALGRAAELASRLKLTGELLPHTALNRLEEIEALALGVEGKFALWQAVQHALGTDPRLAGVDLDELIARARSQRRRLERLRKGAAADALVSDAP
jgi:hypothetical protein